MDPRYLHPASAAFRLKGRSAVPPYTSNHLNVPKRNNLSGSSSITDEDGVIVYDTKKAKRIRKGVSAVPMKSAAAANNRAPEHHPQRYPELYHPEQYRPEYHPERFLAHTHPDDFGTGSNNIRVQAPSIDEEWHGNGHGLYSEEGFGPSLYSVGDSSQQSSHHNWNASWSTMYPWIISEENELRRWEQIQSNMAHNGTFKSPFVPVTFKEYLDLKSETAAAKERAILKRMEDRERDFKLAELPDEVGRGQHREPVRISEKLRHISGYNNLICVNVRHIIWCNCCLENGNKMWPYPMEYGENQGRLPPPRLCELDDQYKHLAFGPNPIPLVGPDVPYPFRKIATRALNPAQDGLMTTEAPDIKMPTQEIDIKDVNPITAALLYSIHMDEYSAI
ncbi:hypothetical protein K449DRAFT_469155 [Hypoxylon sp. EC38]|nr:hypothetical protein K449DRAFT_469155 [Hypoxylon sp. EC38]